MISTKPVLIKLHTLEYLLNNCEYSFNISNVTYCPFRLSESQDFSKVTLHKCYMHGKECISIQYLDRVSKPLYLTKMLYLEYDKYKDVQLVDIINNIDEYEKVSERSTFIHVSSSNILQGRN